ncbi:MAG: hypothetical protein ABSD58_09780 [Verrucomicrobiia bacterium]|jgi:hypothetical protein
MSAKMTRPPIANALVALLIGITGLLCYMGLTNGHDWGDDFAGYIMQAQSIVEGRPREFIKANRSMIEQSSSSALWPAAYPWGFPALLAPIYAVYGNDIIAFKSVGVVCFLLFLWALWLGFRRYHSDFWRLVMVGLFALNPYMLFFMNQILSDIPFLLFSTVSLLLLGAVVVEKRRLISPLADQLLLGALIAVSFSIRTNGINLLLTLGITQLAVALPRVIAQRTTDGRGLASLTRVFSQTTVRRLCVTLVPYATFAILTLVWNTLLPSGGSSYFSLMSGLSLGLIKHHLVYYLDIPGMVFPPTSSYHYLIHGARVAYGVSILLAVAGIRKRYRSDFYMLVYMALTLLLYILWPFEQGIRFLFPVLPFYVSFVLTGLAELLTSVFGPEKTLWKTISVSPVVVILLGCAVLAAKRAFDNLKRNREDRNGPYVQTSRAMFSFVAENTEPTSTIVFFKPRAMKLITGRRSLTMGRVSELSHGDYVCVYLPGKDSGQVAPGDIERFAAEGGIEPVYENRDFALYRLAKSISRSQ